MATDNQPTEREKMLRGEMYCAFTPDLTAARARCKHACEKFNNAGDVPRRRQVELWREITHEDQPLPIPAPNTTDDNDDDNDDDEEEPFPDDPWVEAPIRVDYGFNLRVAGGAFINFNCIFIDTCRITIGARTLLGPCVHIYSGTHPLDPALRNGIKGPEMGKEVHIGEDCWIAGNVTILPGVTIGKGATIGAASVVTKDVPAFHVAVGNPAKVIRRVETDMAET